MALFRPTKPPTHSCPRHIHRFPPQNAADDINATLNLTHPLLSLLDRISCAPKLFRQLQAQLILAGIFHHPLAAGRALKSLPHDRAVLLFPALQYPDAFAANTVLRPLLASAGPAAALRFYRFHVAPRGVLPNHYTLPLLSKACAGVGDRRVGENVHALSVKLGLGVDLYAGNSLISMYFSFQMVGCAGKVFDEMFEHDLVTWNSMLHGYAKNRMLGLARRVFDEMPDKDLVSWNSMITGYMESGDVDGAEELFVAMPVRDMVSWNAMIEGYVRAEKAEVALEVFERMPDRNLVSWNTILALRAKTKKYSECLKLFERMMDSGEAMPDQASFVSVVTACAHTGELVKGKLVHSYIRNKGLEPDLLLSTALLTMYAKCGDMDAARSVFDEMPEKNVVSWNSMIMGYAVNGMVEKSIQMFIEMEKHGPIPNDVTFICVLSACVHGGMVLEGWLCFDCMHRVYKIKPKIEHYGCMVDLLGRAGLLKDSKELLETIAVEPAAPLLGALSSACRNHNSFEFGEILCKKLIELEPSNIGHYVSLSNMYAAEGRWEDVEKLREIMMAKGLQKTAGLSLVDHNKPHQVKPAKGETNIKSGIIYTMMGKVGSLMKSFC